MGQSELFEVVRVDLASFGDIEFYSGDFWFTVVSTLLEFWQRIWTYCPIGAGFQIQKFTFYFKFIVFVIKKPNLSNL